MDVDCREIELRDSLDNPVQGVVSIPANARSTVVMSHGFTSNMNSGLYREFQEKFNELGIGTMRYDYYGHGSLYGHTSGYAVSDSVTLTKTVASLRAVIAYLKTVGQHNIALLGSSFGGLVSFVGASEDTAVKLLVLKSPVTEPKLFWQQRLGDERIENWKQQGTLFITHDIVDYYLEYNYWVDLQSYDTMQLAGNIRCPVLIVHGEKDSVVPIDQSQRLAKALGTEVQVVMGAEHSYSEPLQQAEMKRMIINFVSQWAQTV